MRDLFFPGRSVVHAVNGAAATSHPLSTLTAIETLKSGGNAVDAAIAASAVQAVVEPQSTGIGGDCFALISKGGGDDIVGLNGSGRAPAALNADVFLEKGESSIGLTSAHAVTVPGAIDAWARLAADHGVLGLDRLLAPAISFAEDGFAVTPRTGLDWYLQEAKLAADDGARRMYLADGKAPAAGARWTLPELGRTLRAVAREGRAGFYEGAVAEAMVRSLRARGGLHTMEDFAAAACDYVTPISTCYADHDVVQIPPNGQGITSLIMLNILKGFDPGNLDPQGAARYHLEAEATRLAYAVRNRYVADPAFADVPVAKLLSEEFAAELRADIDPERAGRIEEEGAIAAYRDTVYITVVDRDRTACSFINSLYFPFGSGIACPETGVMFQNRGAGFIVEPGHPNCVAPGKRPLHTIIPGMVLKDGKVSHCYGVMGGGYQPVGHAHVLSNMFDYGMDPQEALDSPRAFLQEGALECEPGIPEKIRSELARMGHRVAEPPRPLGGGQIIAVDWERGTLAAGSDPRKDGLALGY
jgi:gamma-glutamyltranspeptidase/glutathione hydrolase